MCLNICVRICKYIYGRRGVHGVACTQAGPLAQADRILLMCIDLFVCIHIYVSWACIYIFGRREVHSAAYTRAGARAQANRILYHICIDLYVFICICMYM